MLSTFSVDERALKSTSLFYVLTLCNKRVKFKSAPNQNKFLKLKEINILSRWTGLKVYFTFLRINTL